MVIGPSWEGVDDLLVLLTSTSCHAVGRALFCTKVQALAKLRDAEDAHGHHLPSWRRDPSSAWAGSIPRPAARAEVLHCLFGAVDQHQRVAHDEVDGHPHAPRLRGSVSEQALRSVSTPTKGHGVDLVCVDGGAGCGCDDSGPSSSGDCRGGAGGGSIGSIPACVKVEGGAHLCPASTVTVPWLSCRGHAEALTATPPWPAGQIRRATAEGSATSRPKPHLRVGPASAQGSKRGHPLRPTEDPRARWRCRSLSVAVSVASRWP